MSMDKNFNDADIAVNKMTEQCKKELVQAYAESLKSIRNSLSYIYEKYSQDGSLTYADMTKYNRLLNLEKEIRDELYNFTGANAKRIKTLIGDVYEESFFRTAFAIEAEAQVKLAYGMLNPEVIKASIQNPLSGMKLDERLEKNRDNIITNVRQQITQGLVQGESYPRMAKRIKTVLESDAQKAIRVVKTEAHRVQQESRLASMQHAADKGIKMVKVWMATLDGTVRDTHGRLDGQKVAIDEEFYIGRLHAKAPGHFGDPAEDINCRCTIRAELVGYEPKVRRSREDGIIPYTNYEDWKLHRI